MSDAPTTTTGKLVWEEPSLRTLDINETQGFPNRGADANRHADCTRS